MTDDGKKGRAEAEVAAAKKKDGSERPKRPYEPPLIKRIDLPGLSDEPLDSGTPLLAQESSTVTPATLVPPPQ